MREFVEALVITSFDNDRAPSCIQVPLVELAFLQQIRHLRQRVDIYGKGGEELLNLRRRGPNQTLRRNRGPYPGCIRPAIITAHAIERLVQQIIDAARSVIVQYTYLQRNLAEHSVSLKIGYVHHINLFRALTEHITLRLAFDSPLATVSSGTRESWMLTACGEGVPQRLRPSSSLAYYLFKVAPHRMATRITTQFMCEHRGIGR